MWPANEFDESRLVNLLLGVEKVVVQEESSFLATISPFFRATFYSGFAEANVDSIELPECDANAMQLILEKLHKAKSENTSIDEAIKKMISPALFATLSFLGVGSLNLGKLALDVMSLNETEGYASAAKQTGNLKLLKMVELRSLGLFCEYRKTEGFKNKTIEQLVAYLKHPFLEYSEEMEVLDAVLIWLNFDFKQRERHLEKAMSCVYWNKITHIPAEVLSRGKSLCVTDFFGGINKLKAENKNIPNVIVHYESEMGFGLAKKLMEESKWREEKKFFMSVPFAYRFGPAEEKFKFGICIYDLESNEFQDQVFFLPIDDSESFSNVLGYVNVVYYDFNVYSFMRPCNNRPPWGFHIEKHPTLGRHQQSQWITLNSYGHGLENRMELIRRDSLKHTAFSTDEPFFSSGGAPLPAVTKSGENIVIQITETVKFNLKKGTICHVDPNSLPKPPPSTNHIMLHPGDHPNTLSFSRVPCKKHSPSKVTNLCAVQINTKFKSWKAFEEKVQAHVAPKVGRAMLDFKASEDFIRHVNPLWFTKID